MMTAATLAHIWLRTGMTHSIRFNKALLYATHVLASGSQWSVEQASWATATKQWVSGELNNGNLFFQSSGD